MTHEIEVDGEIVDVTEELPPAELLNPKDGEESEED